MKLSVWKDRPGRTRIMAILGNGKHEDARRYYYKQYHPKEDIKGFRILQLTTYKILHRDCKIDNLKNISKISGNIRR